MKLKTKMSLVLGMIILSVTPVMQATALDIITSKDVKCTETGENCLPITENNLILPCGIYGKITKNYLKKTKKVLFLQYNAKKQQNYHPT